ncbi:DUF928 domain-containing protein [Phormidium tenue]|uniref:DUF928 domain-containing protein n=1 Tax=Phormidium tenue NIES-30 TaxID=549789 RepID=A0A1U7IY44_9CYAN|nr:DUF928 domain-containing protein [Phormidium tenue]MBD2234792.1 DUF928 domain-containing protein [Phormidium tenue FACHB-1052]OKH43519.1 hypothetical protein NIES30_24665 [Phormidium tenue NIES-30]
MHKSAIAAALLTLGSLTGVFLSVGNPSWGNEVTLHSSPLIAQSSNRRGYEPPPTSRAPRRTVGGGTRGGCDGSAPINLTALASQSHIGATTTRRPTLVWYVPEETPYQMQLQLYRYAAAEGDELTPVNTFELGESQQGYTSFTLPEDEPALAVGSTYRWKVILLCNPGQPSKVALDEADLQVVAATSGAAIGQGNLVDRAEQAIAAGLWYDAIALLSQTPVSPEAAAYRRDLLAGLAEQEALNPNDGISLFSDRLNYLAEQE